MDEFFPPRNEAMVSPLFPSGPPTDTSKPSPPWIVGEPTGVDNEPRTTEQDFGSAKNKDSNSEPEYLLYYYPHSFHSQKVMMTLLEKDIQFKSRLVNINLDEQFHDDFLAINSKAEVPVLKDLKDDTIIIDSLRIMDYLEEKYISKPRVPKLIPEVEPWKSLHMEFLTKLNSLRVEAITLGSAYFVKFCNLTPHYPYSSTPARLHLQEIAIQRVIVLREHANRLRETNPEASLLLHKKATDAELEGQAMRDIRSFDRIVLTFENVLDDCEAQLQHNWIEENNPDHWLICPFITHADIVLALTLQRLWQLGFNDRIFSGTRPQLQKYFKRMKGVYSFTQSAPLESEINYWPWMIGIGGLAVLVAIESFWRRS